MTRKRILLLYAGFLAFLLIATYVVLLQTGVSRTFVENVIAKFIVRGRFTLEGADVDLGEGLATIEGLEIGGDGGGEPPVMRAESVQVGFSTNPLGEVGAVKHVKVEGLHLSLDLSTGQPPDLNEFLQQTPVRAADAPRDTIPPIRVVDSTISIKLYANADPVVFTDVKLELRPEEAGSPKTVLSGTMLDPNGFQVNVSGGGDLSEPRFLGLLTLSDIPIEPNIAGPYSREVVDFLGQVGTTGAARRLVVWVEFKPPSQLGGDEASAGVKLEFDDISFRLPQLPYPIVGASARISANTTDGGTVKFQVENESVDGNIKGEGTLTNVFAGMPIADVSIETTGMLVSPVLADSMQHLDATRRVWQAFEPSGGRADAKVHLTNTVPGEKLLASLDLDLRGVAARFVGFAGEDGEPEFGFPRPLSEVTGRVQVHDGTVYVHDVTALMPEGQIQISGTVATRSEGEPTLELDIESEQLGFSDGIRSALAAILPGLDEVYDDYSPDGDTALDVQLRFGPDVDEPGAYVRLRPLGCSATYIGFPYRLDQLRGLIEILPNGVTFSLDGNRDIAQLTIDGRFLEGEDETSDRLSSELWIQAKDIVLTPQFGTALDALTPVIGKTLAFVGLDGGIDCEVSLWRGRGEEDFSYDIRVDLDEGAAQLENLQIPIKKLVGPVFVHGTGTDSRIDVSAVHGEIANSAGEPPATVLVQGTVHAKDDDFSMDLTSVVRHLKLTDVVGQAMDKNGTFSLATWNILKPAGHVDVLVRQQKRIAQADYEMRLRLQLDGVSSSAAMLPAPATELYGEVMVEQGTAFFRDIHGRMDKARVHCSSGTAEHEGDTSVLDMTVSSDDFPVDDRLANLMTGPLKETYLSRDADGTIGIDRLHLRFEFPDGEDQFEIAVEGAFVAHDIAMTIGTRIQNMRGAWRIKDGLITQEGGWIDGEIQNGEMTIHGHRTSGIATQFRADTDRLVFRQSEGRIHNGRVFGTATDGEPDLVYEYAGEGKLQFDLQWDAVRLSELLRASGVPGERFRGNLAGRLRLEELIGARFIDAKGDGRVAISQGRLGEVPIFTAIYSYLTPSRRPQFESVSLDFAIGGRRIDVRDLRVTSPLLTATGEGTVGMNGYVEMVIDFPDLFGTAADWLVLPEVINIVSNLWKFDIYGYLRAPKARPRWLWQGQPGRARLAPIPAARPRRKGSEP